MYVSCCQFGKYVLARYVRIKRQTTHQGLGAMSKRQSSGMSEVMGLGFRGKRASHLEALSRLAAVHSAVKAFFVVELQQFPPA